MTQLLTMTKTHKFPLQESALVEELLYCLVGNGTSHIQPVRNKGTTTASFTFKLDPNIDSSLKSLMLRILPLCENYSKVVGWCEGDEITGMETYEL